MKLGTQTGSVINHLHSRAVIGQTAVGYWHASKILRHNRGIATQRSPQVPQAQLPLTAEQIATLPVFTYGTLEHDDHLRRIRDRHTGEYREHSYWVVRQGLNLEHKTLCVSHIGLAACSMWDL